MKRREFVKSAGLSALGAGLAGPLESIAAESGVTRLQSDELSPSASIADDYDLHFMAVGDWGRNGEYDQAEVAKQMGVQGTTRPNNFVISVGDNFYPKGVVSEHDPLWDHSFEDIYTAHALQCDWYPVLGNHDHLADPQAQVRYSQVSRRWNLPSLYYTKLFNLRSSNKKVQFIMIDTDPFLFEAKKEYCDKQLAWLKETLTNTPADVKWRIVVGHHPYYTVGPRIKNYDTLIMRKTFADLFEQHKVDIYLSGHDHSLQHLKPQGRTHQLISGAGSELTPVTQGVSYTKFAASEHGFMYFSVKADQINIKAIDKDGKLLYETNIG